jgi:hypothetical protein
MNFLTEISNKGFTIRCYFEKNNNHIGYLHLNTIYDNHLFPDVQNQNYIDAIDPIFSLLISAIFAHLEDDISDPFDYNIDEDYGYVTINNQQLKIRLPANIRDMFINNLNNHYIYNDIINSILEKLQDYNDQYYIDLFNKLRNMKIETHYINVIRNERQINIGVGKIYCPPNYNFNMNHINDMINEIQQEYN